MGKIIRQEAIPLKIFPDARAEDGIEPPQRT